MDYSVWSILEQKVSATRYATVETLKTALTRAWDKIGGKKCATIIENFRKRLQKCIEAKEGNFENLLKFFLFTVIVSEPIKSLLKKLVEFIFVYGSYTLLNFQKKLSELFPHPVYTYVFLVLISLNKILTRNVVTLHIKYCIMKKIHLIKYGFATHQPIHLMYVNSE